jgi:hypothetical protein
MSAEFQGGMRIPLGDMGTHSPEAVALLAQLDEDLQKSSKRTGKTLVWTTADRQVIDLIASTVDRRADLHRLYSSLADDDIKTRIKLSAELRLIESSLARLMKMVSTEVPAPMSLRSVKAQRAANVRWARDA